MKNTIIDVVFSTIVKRSVFCTGMVSVFFGEEAGEAGAMKTAQTLLSVRNDSQESGRGGMRLRDLVRAGF